MTQAPKKTAAARTPAVPEEITALLGNNGENFEAIVRANEALASGMAAWGQEVMGFASKRLSENMKRSESLMQCKDPEQAFDLTCDFARKATEQYLEEANKLLGLVSDISRSCWTPLERRTKEALHGMNGK
jgi:hypothetical protein